jgi:hypothetical protein
MGPPGISAGTYDSDLVALLHWDLLPAPGYGDYAVGNLPSGVACRRHVHLGRQPG